MFEYSYFGGYKCLKFLKTKQEKDSELHNVFLCIISYAMFYAVYSGCNYRRQIFSYSVLDLMSFIGGTADGTLGDAF